MKKQPKPSRQKKYVTVKVRQGDQIMDVEKPSLLQAGWVLQCIADAIRQRPSFRQFVYGIMGYPRPEEPGSEGTYAVLYLAGGMEVTNTLFNCSDERFMKLEEIVKAAKELVPGDIRIDNTRGPALETLVRLFKAWEDKTGSKPDVYMGKRGTVPKA